MNSKSIFFLQCSSALYNLLFIYQQQVFSYEQPNTDDDVDNNQFNLAAPIGRLRIWIDNPNAKGFFKIGARRQKFFEQPDERLLVASG